MPLIKFKRGLINSLPLLSSGEPALATDSGEFFIGDGEKNLNFTPVNPNLIINGNFQIALTSMDSEKEIAIMNNTNYRVFGNFLIKNVAGNVFMSRPSTGSRIRIRCENAAVEFDYYEILCTYYDAAGNHSYIDAFQGSEVTLSYTISNQTGAPFQTTCGLGAQRRMIPVGLSRVTVTYTLQGGIACNLIYTLSNVTGTIEIGDVKLEMGKRATPFFPNAIAQDFAALTQCYRTYSIYLRCSAIAQNWVDFTFPIDIANGMKNNVVPILNKIQVNNINGAPQDNFVGAISIVKQQQPGTLALYGLLRCTKTNHGLTDAGARVDYSLDMRG